MPLTRIKQSGIAANTFVGGGGAAAQLADIHQAILLEASGIRSCYY